MPKIYYRKEKLRGACWEYPVQGGWITLATPEGERSFLHHSFTFHRPKEVEVHTESGVQTLERSAAEQWFFVDRWFSLLRFLTSDDRTVGYYVNFSRPLTQIKENYFRDLDLELDLWLDPDGTATELDREEFDEEIAQQRMEQGWADEVTRALSNVSEAVQEVIQTHGRNLDVGREANQGLPEFILKV